MTHDSINDEIRAIRRELAARCGNDLAMIFADARARQATDGRNYVRLPPRRLSKEEARDVDDSADPKTASGQVFGPTSLESR